MTPSSQPIPPEALQVFETLPDAYLVLSPDLRILAVSQAYLIASLTRRKDLLGQFIFEVFPRRLNTDGIPTVQASLDRVLATLCPHRMEIIRYDLPHPTHPGEFVERYWSTTHTPVLDEEGALWYIIHRTDNVTLQVKAQRLVEHSQKSMQSVDEELAATVEELRVSNEELIAASLALEQFNAELEDRVEQRTYELTQARKDIQRERDRLKRFFMQAPSAICILDGPDLVFELVNPAYQQLFSTRQLLEVPLRIALPELVDQPVWSALQQVYNTGKTYQGQEVPVSIVREEGGPLERGYYNFIYQARFNELDLVDGIMVFAYEVTDQVVARQAVEASAHRLQLITDALPVLISYVDKDEVYRFVNLAYREWFEQPTDQILGHSIRDVVGEEAYQNAKEYIDRALAGERLDFEADMTYRENFRRYIHTSYVPNVQQGQVVGFYALVTDISEHMRDRQKMIDREKEAHALAYQLTAANHALLSSNDQLTRTNADLDNFIYTASHDLKAPISNIESLISALVRALPDEQIADEHVQRILSLMDTSIERFKRTIAHLTEIVKLQKEHEEHAVSVDVSQVVREVWLDLDFMVDPSEAELVLDIDDCPLIQFSEKNMRSVVYNLLSNAIKYQSPDRAPRIRIGCESTPHYHVIIVEDNGLGIEKKRIPQLFSMFKRFHDHVEGTGIGLYMVKKIVESAGGKIEVDSQLNQGTTFRVFFSTE